jgi:ABC-2 type transport system ATP-binding protein
MPLLPPLPVLQAQSLSFSYPGQPPLFTRYSVDLPTGITLLDGDTGSGKSTLLQLLGGDLKPNSGRLTLNGHDLASHPAAYRQQLCWFDPRDEAFDALTPAALMAAQRAVHPGLDEAAWQRHLAGFDLGPHLSKPFYALSTGSRRKAGLAVALATGAALTLLDEPTAGLDAGSLAYLALALNEAATRQPRCAWLLASSQGLAGLALAGAITLPAAAAATTAGG